MSKDRAMLAGLKFAHRGLYDNENGVPENSLAAFRAAMEAGVGVELDVRLTKDGRIVVFHDNTLDRLCGVSGRVEDCTLYELKQLRLLGTDEAIPLFTDVWSLLAEGRVPAIVEIKAGVRSTELCEKLVERLSRYSVPYAIESFDPRIVRWFYKNAPETIRGRLVTSEKGYRSSHHAVTAWILARPGFLCMDHPDFIAWNEDIALPRHLLKKQKKGLLLVGWTSRQPDADLAVYDSVIFEESRAQF